ncbi:endonuclease/exonuclease/phosphatase family protein [Kribbia dieselivorans]|uniref:endonuclease/exonuclease/phosphatase family protein n=1 Tax=Kribbia dieselivorans TaxID=331526 RepID=UPI000838ECD3|nr:endonuclease/exonuclease/phosphatase family protein [Kribbia dieselivorans]
MRLRSPLTGVLALALTGAIAVPAVAAQGGIPGAPSAVASQSRVDQDVRFATYNASLNRFNAGDLLTHLNAGNQQARNLAEVIQRNNPDVLLVNEFDYVADGSAARAFRDTYLAVGQNGAAGVDYPYFYVAPVNTGVPSGFDLNNDGKVGGGDDAKGFGFFPGQYGMVVYSKFPIDTANVRTFQNFLWKDMPGALLPDNLSTPAANDWYSPEELAILPLSSKSHWDVPIQVDKNKTVHFLTAHPTPPSFDGPEDRNGKRNHDEIRLWADYVAGGKTASYIYDDNGTRGGLKAGSTFVIAGDYNADPLDGDSVNGAINQLLGNKRVNSTFTPASEGGAQAAARQGGANLKHKGNPAFDTADFADGAPGNLRVDMVLPSKGLPVRDGGVYWLTKENPLYDRLIGDWSPTRSGNEWGGNGFPTSDHKLVWIDVNLPHKR